ncbi:MAG: YlxR family protein [Eubacterium sp.]|nr:YlxR family protein [Eubacterium sp.]
MKTKKIPSRICVGCREPREKQSMVRVVKTAENEICLDVTGRKNGRGAYICKNTECLQRAIQTKGLERSLKTQIPEQVINLLKEEMSAVEAR